MNYFREHIASIVISAVMALLILFFISPDSYTHDLFGRGDSALYYLLGKSWMTGQTPYVDFSAPQGPLLWLIYGIGYLLSPHSYTGVFWICVCFYAVTFFFTYRTAHLFLGRRLSWIATALMAFAFFNPLFRYEIRCEDYCLAPMTISLYLVCKTFYNRHTSRHHLNLRALLLGACLGFALLMKCSIALMQAVFPLAFLVYAWRRNHGFWRLLARILGGLLLVFAPFVVWFAMDGVLPAFVHDYVLSSILPSQSTGGTLLFAGFTASHTWLAALTLFIISLAGVILMRSHLIRWTFFPLVSFLWVFLLCLHQASHNYHYIIVTPFLVFLAVSLLKLPPEPVRERMRRMSLPLMTLIAIVCIAVNYVLGTRSSLFHQDNSERKAFYDIASTMEETAQKKKDEHPKVLYFSEPDAYDVPCEAVAGQLHVLRQEGELVFMTELNKEACRLGVPDFVIADDNDASTYAFLDSCGYELATRHLFVHLRK